MAKISIANEDILNERGQEGISCAADRVNSGSQDTDKAGLGTLISTD